MTNRKSHKSFQIRRTSSILNDLEGSLSTFVEKRYVVGDGDDTVEGDDEFL